MPRQTQRGRAINFNAQWSGKAEDLQKIGQQNKGICGCQDYCNGSTKPIYGHTFRLHMSWKLSAQAFSSARSTSLSRLPSNHLLPIPGDTQPEAGPSGRPYNENPDPFDSSAGDAWGEEMTADVEAAEDGWDGDAEVAAEERDEDLDLYEEESDYGHEEALEDERLRSRLEQEITDALPDALMDNTPTPGLFTPQEQLRLTAILDSLSEMPDAGPVSSPEEATALTYGHQLRGQLPEDDLLLIWPFPIPTYLLYPSHAGNLPNPFTQEDATSTTEMPLLSRTFPLLALTLSGRFGVPRRAVELVLRVASTAVRLAERQMYERMTALYRQHALAVPLIPWETVEALDPVNRDDIAPRTAASALKSIGVDTHLLVHPQCRNSLCHHVFYEVRSQTDLHTLPPLCPECNTPLRIGERMEVLFFPRRELWRELEVVLAVPGVEEAVENRQRRKEQRIREDNEQIAKGGATYQKVLREQDDGQGWHPPAQLNSNAALDDCLTLTVNLGFDSANPSSHRSASAYSMAPITLFLADLPVQVRSSTSCVMVVGICPGPKEPKGENLHKLLLPIILELRSSQQNGIWVRTPKFPQGRLIRVILGCVIADRPAAIMVSGGGHYSAHDTPCIRCLVHQDDLPKCDIHPNRLSRPHMKTCIEQYVRFRTELAKDQEQYMTQQEDLKQRGLKHRNHYPDSRGERLRQKIYEVRGHVSVLALIPGYDTFPSIPFDAMHMLLEGTVRAYFFSVLVRGDHDDREEDGAGGSESEAMSEGTALEMQQQANDFLDEAATGQVRKRTKKEIAQLRALAKAATKKAGPHSKRLLGPVDLARMQELLAEVQIPMCISRLHPLFGCASAGSPSADDWRTFASVFAPLVLPRLWHEHQLKVGDGEPRLTDEELSAFMGVCEIAILGLRSSLSDYQLDHLHDHIMTWSKDVFRLHPSLKRKTNFHLPSHFVDDIRRFGPPYNTWSFAVERLNFIAKNVPQASSSVARQVATMRAMMLARQVEGRRTVHLDAGGLADNVEMEAAEELGTAFQATNGDRASSTLEMLGMRFEEADRRTTEILLHHRAGETPVRLRGEGVKTTLQPSLQRSLQACLQRDNIPCRLNARPSNDADALLPYLPATIVAHDGVEWGRLRFDSAQRIRSSSTTGPEPSPRNLASSRNSLFEIQTPNQRFGLLDEDFITGVVCLVFEHQAVMVGAQGERIEQERKLFAIVRLFEAYTGEDPYRYDRFSLLGTRLWLADSLKEPVVMALSPQVLAGFRPLALARLPIEIDGKDESFVWATQPIDRD